MRLLNNLFARMDSNCRLRAYPAGVHPLVAAARQGCITLNCAMEQTDEKAN